MEKIELYAGTSEYTKILIKKFLKKEFLDARETKEKNNIKFLDII